MSPTRAQKRWSPRLRTAGALLLLFGVVGLVDRLLPRGADSVDVLPAAAQLAAAAGALVAGGALFALGRLWR
jgi:hypothetical protein